MAHFKKIPQTFHEGKINYGKGIIDGIVFLAINELDFVKFAFPKEESKKTSDIIKVTQNKNTVDVSVKIMIHYSQSVSDIAFKVQEAVRHNIETMTEYKLNSVNVNVCGVMFDDSSINKKEKEEKLKLIEKAQEKTEESQKEKTV
ncbi:MAG: Asp23/Gls24 family envelope stress response protein [Firmicutes bacterium]|nr:Asp23/Gls24 family envelope stress response protein [Candidatus Caballimonas caccae]